MAIAPERGPSPRPLAWHGPRLKRPSNEARLQECQKSRKELTRHPIVRPRRPSPPLARNEYAYTEIWAAPGRGVILLAFFKTCAFEENFSKKLAGHD